ncbi:MAG TPA: SRPBCC family protein [Blastocatellia bacterium]|nr:SRPBCC family protein [Blastocatellia bacterium]
MATFERSIEINAPRAALFTLTQDYTRRLQWDPFLREARLVNGADKPAVGVRAWCVARTGMGMETEYVSFNPPERTAVKMTRGPRILRTFAGSWIFEAQSENRTRVIFRYHVSVSPGWLSFVLEPILRKVFSNDIRRRLEALKRAVEMEGLLDDKATRA